MPITTSSGFMHPGPQKRVDALNVSGAPMSSLGKALKYPCIAATLRDPLIANPQARARRLERKALTWLDHVIAHFDKQVPA